ncbi:MAG TPA: GAF domain-containing protein [Tepidisphaeraceae bacterium]|jgi:GAF domain-containing protein|nr:GAF domain-containing protein [Tepidisphaeraceae bacterium]
MNPDTLQSLKKILSADGVRAALVYLNGLTPHRFTALYRFDDQTLRNAYFFDRDQPEIESCPDIPVLASYCVFVRGSGQTFMTPDSLADERVAGHPKRLVVRSYCGVPLVDEQGRVFGTICHFDYGPIPISDVNVDLMESLAPLLMAEAR